MMPDQLTLPACVLPGCRTPVTAWGDTRGDCLADFGPLLRLSRHRLDRAAIRARDDAVRAAYAIQGVDT